MRALGVWRSLGLRAGDAVRGWRRRDRSCGPAKGDGKLNHPSFAADLPTGAVIASDDANPRWSSSTAPRNELLGSMGSGAVRAGPWVF